MFKNFFKINFREKKNKIFIGQKPFFISALFFAGLFLIILAFNAVFAWNSPTSSPPNSAGQALYINTSGNVGIGTTTPAQKLHVSGSGAQYIILEGTGDTDILSRYTNGTYNAYSGLLGSSAGPGKWGVYNNGAPRMVIDTAGNVGIGTTAPAWKLDVVGGSMRADGYTGGGQLCIGSDCRASWPNGGSGFTGGGTTNYIPKWTSGTSLSNSTIFDDGTTVTVNSTYIRGATYGFGGMYVLNTPDSSCRRTNPFTGGCSCPAGFSAGWASDGADFHSWFCYK